jgi:outer membrane protein assembly factor BamD
MSMLFTSLKTPAILVLGALLVTGCSSTPEDKYVDRPVEELYNEAMNIMQGGGYQRAARAFDEVDRQHPYSVWATKAQLMAAYSLYEANKYDEAIIGLDRFIQLHPSNRDAGYAYYLKALSYYEQIADVNRDQKNTAEALRTLQEVIDRFPTSRYANDARLKIDLARDHLAGKEMTVGRLYQTQRQYLAAVGRYRYVVDNYQTTSHVPEALHRLIECYTSLGLQDEAKRVAAVLGHNFPGNEWYSDSYNLVQTGELPKRKSFWKDWLSW